MAHSVDVAPTFRELECVDDECIDVSGRSVRATGGGWPARFVWRTRVSTSVQKKSADATRENEANRRSVSRKASHLLGWRLLGSLGLGLLGRRRHVAALLASNKLLEIRRRELIDARFDLSAERRVDLVELEEK